MLFCWMIQLYINTSRRGVKMLFLCAPGAPGVALGPEWHRKRSYTAHAHALYWEEGSAGHVVLSVTLRPQKRRLIRDGSPGQPPRLSHSCWALNPGWVTATCQLTLHPSRNFPGVKFCVDSTKVLGMVKPEWSEVPRVRIQYAGRSHRHVRDPAVHVGVWWIMETLFCLKIF